MNAYQPTNLVSTIIALIFYVIMAVFAIYSLSSIYTLIRFGRSKALATAVSILYLIIAGSLYVAAVANLEKIRL
jgi:hypothetical protein